ncbi:hypothetical protein Pmani_002284 [Petrolisthes manimaculis]|uniref:Probable proline--tRNA ligase, mitochondrial n=1 Tax=Petrolisthes manimaculis TaxID=1843537 RepID=A0AAE1UJI0_9EUCA|nr:hypothetical protein Pmani_002284 [Petrolisthes manimaculis]
MYQSIHRLYHHHCLSKIFQPVNLKPKDSNVKKDEPMSLSQKLLVETGIISLRSNGMFALLPLGQRILKKLMMIIDEEMISVGAQRLTLPLLTSADLWKITGRWNSTGQELLSLQDRHNREYVLSPTHEEAITSLLRDVYPLSFRQLPLKLYQITSKFRDEMKPRFGLIRCREFVMKDLYTFDESEAKAIETYSEICNAYDNIFQRIGVPYIKVAGDCGNIGGSFSHEYHYQAAIGEDTLLVCHGCQEATNIQLLSDSVNAVCSKCGSDMATITGIEVGHTFLLGTKYSEPLGGCYQNKRGKPEAAHMGCYGVGLTRVMAAVVEVLTTSDNIIWPWEIAPFKVCIIGPKEGSLEAGVTRWVNHLAKVLSSLPGYEDDIVVDDRHRLTIGKRVLEARRTGYPYIVVVGKKAQEDVPMFELIHTMTDESCYLSHHMLITHMRGAA